MPEWQSYSFDQINELPTDIYCLELYITPEQFHELKSSERQISPTTLASWRKVLDHFSSVQCLHFGPLHTELTPVLDDFAKKFANDVTKLIFQDYAGSYTEWHCNLCEAFPNVYTMHFEFSDIRHLDFGACIAKKIKYSADAWSVDRAKRVEKANGGLIAPYE